MTIDHLLGICKLSGWILLIIGAIYLGFAADRSKVERVSTQWLWLALALLFIGDLPAMRLAFRGVIGLARSLS